jgi:hypothetical protein
LQRYSGAINLGFKSHSKDEVIEVKWLSKVTSEMVQGGYFSHHPSRVLVGGVGGVNAPPPGITENLVFHADLGLRNFKKWLICVESCGCEKPLRGKCIACSGSIRHLAENSVSVHIMQ